MNTFLEGRLTALPAAASETTGTPSAPTTKELIASRKGALLQGGIYIPMYPGAWVWEYGGDRNALFVAPFFKAGVQTITGDKSATEPRLIGDDTLFTSWSVGARIGHFRLPNSRNESSEWISYLDITRGKWESFERCVVPTSCDPTATPRPQTVRPWRTALEGRLKIPGLPLVVGFDINNGSGRDDFRLLFGTKFDIGELFGVLRAKEAERTKEQK